jgi:hypothetical protein
MAHEDQFTATGPSFTEAGFERAAFSTGREGTDSTYGVNVQGSFCGVYGESAPDSDRTADVPGVGVFGVGQNFGVFGKGTPGGGIAGVFGQHNRGGVGIIGAAMRGGTGIVGASVGSLGNPLATFAPVKDPADGSGTGVFGTSGEGAGVRGSSREGNGVIGTSMAGDGVVGGSDADVKSGVFGFNTLQTGAAFGVSGKSDSPDGAGINGFSDPGVGVKGTSKTNDGVVGSSSVALKSGVFGFNTLQTGAAFGVSGSSDSPDGAGIHGISDQGYGGHFRGGRAPLRLVPANTPGDPSSGNHQRGELFVDSNGDLFFCKDSGTPGNWFRVGLTPA